MCEVKIVSGGQTGVDRAALDAALAAEVPHGGWCPRGRLAEDGRIDPCYRLRETDSCAYDERTERNVLDADATLIFSRQRQLTGGTALTQACAQRHGKPVMVLHESDPLPWAVDMLASFVASRKIRVLNVAGPRESQAPGLGRYVRLVLDQWLQRHPGRTKM